MDTFEGEHSSSTESLITSYPA